MKAVIQRVGEASVSIAGKVKGKIDSGLLILLGIGDEDNKEDALWLSNKILNLRIFSDQEGKMNRSVLDVEGGILVISQFTLHASTKKGNRPSFIAAAAPEKAIPMYENFLSLLEEQLGSPVESGEFGAMMDVSLVNSGPVTIIIDTKNKV